MSEKKEMSTSEAVITLLGLPLIWASTFAYTVPLREMWLWVAVPVFHAPRVSYAQAWGLLCLLSYLKYRYDVQKSEKTTSDTLLETVLLIAMAYGSMATLWVLLRIGA